LVVVRQAEVYQLHVVVVIQQNVFRLEIAMSYVKPMQILNSIKYLIKYSSRSPLLESNFVSHYLEKLSLLRILGYDINKVSCFNDLIEVNDVWVSNFFHDLNLSLNSNFIIFIFDSEFIYDFDGDFFSSGYV
jgi:hypothetical protein